MQEMLAARPAAKVQKSIEKHFLTMGSYQNPIRSDKIRKNEKIMKNRRGRKG